MCYFTGQTTLNTLTSNHCAGQTDTWILLLPMFMSAYGSIIYIPLYEHNMLCCTYLCDTNGIYASISFPSMFYVRMNMLIINIQNVNMAKFVFVLFYKRLPNI